MPAKSKEVRNQTSKRWYHSQSKERREVMNAINNARKRGTLIYREEVEEEEETELDKEMDRKAEEIWQRLTQKN